MKGLIASVMERHEAELLSCVDYCDTFKLLKAKWEQNQVRALPVVHRHAVSGCPSPVLSLGGWQCTATQ